MSYQLRPAVFGALLALAASLPLAAADAPLAGHTVAVDQGYGVIGEYCSKCHNTEDWAGGVAFDTLSPTTVPENGKVWEAAVRKLRGRLMPPPGNPQPSQARIDQLVGWLEGSLDRGQAGPRTGHVSVQRLNRTEYANAVRDLLGVDINPKDLLPPENEVEGFDNVAAALSVSPAFLDQYLGAARTVAHLAVGDAVPKVANTTWPAPGGAQDSYVDGLPLGTRGGMTFRHNFPADGEYKINVLDLDIGLYPAAAETRHTLVILIDGREVFRGDVGGREDLATVDQKAAAGSKEIMQRFQNIPVRVKAGVRDVVVTFIERSRATSDEYVSNGAGGFGGGGFDRLRVPRLLDGIQVVGPLGPATLSMSASRAKIFVCQPNAVGDERTCAAKIAQHLTRRAYRRPVDASDVNRLMPFFDAGRKDGGNFDAGVQQLVAAVLASPDFLYRVIRPSTDGSLQALSDLELATRLSFFLWSQGPDDTLIDLAAAGKLKDPQVLAAQVRRMLADPHADQLVEGFALKWLNLDELEQVVPDNKLFPGYSASLRDDFTKELVLFLKSVMLGDENLVRMLDADYTFLNERLARHYGIANVFGPQFRRVQLTDDRRFGLMGKSAMLLRTSYGDRTSPVLRGAWVLDKLLGTPPTPPPPNTATDLSQPPGEKPKTVRARLELHRSNASCNACHGVIDPIGLALENFDTIGRWRDVDPAAQAKIDASSKLPNGVAISGPQQLRAELLKRPDQFIQALTQKLMMYGINREIEYSDMPAVRAIVHASAQQNYTLSSIVTGIVASDAFRLQAPARVVKPLPTQSVSNNP